MIIARCTLVCHQMLYSWDTEVSQVSDQSDIKKIQQNTNLENGWKKHCEH